MSLHAITMAAGREVSQNAPFSDRTVNKIQALGKLNGSHVTDFKEPTIYIHLEGTSSFPQVIYREEV